jgi:hypothetical protein
MTILQRIIGSWKTTVGGISVGAALMVLVSFMLTQFGVNLSGTQMGWLLSMVGLGPAVVGALATDDGRSSATK